MTYTKTLFVIRQCYIKYEKSFSNRSAYLKGTKSRPTQLPESQITLSRNEYTRMFNGGKFASSFAHFSLVLHARKSLNFCSDFECFNLQLIRNTIFIYSESVVFKLWFLNFPKINARASEIHFKSISQSNTPSFCVSYKNYNKKYI
jgi:hypothetical protein